MQQSTNTEPVYVISVAARLAALPCWVLRVLDQEGIVVPVRTDSNRRLYSDRDIVILARVRHWTEERGVNIAGVKVLLEMEEEHRNLETQDETALKPALLSASPERNGSAGAGMGAQAAIAGATARLPLPAFKPTSIQEQIEP